MTLETPALLQPVVLFGAGGHSSSVADVLQRIGCNVAGRVTATSSGELDNSGTLVGDEAGIVFARANGARAMVAIGNNALRATTAERIPEELWSLSVTARTASVSRSSTLGLLSIVMEHAHVGPDAHVGTGTIINTAAVVEHDCTVGAFAHIAPGAVLLGQASVGFGAFIGAGARVLPGITVGSRATVGAGAVVREDVPNGSTVVGVPAKKVTE